MTLDSTRGTEGARFAAKVTVDPWLETSNDDADRLVAAPKGADLRGAYDANDLARGASLIFAAAMPVAFVSPSAPLLRTAGARMAPTAQREVGGLDVTSADLQQIMPEASPADVQRFTIPLNATMREFDINTPARRAAFLAQVAHESGQLRCPQETASGQAYEGRRDLGNTRRGDGPRYKGRGLIHITGRFNYRALGRAFKVDLEGKPQVLASNAYLAARSAGWFWHENDLNTLADRGNFLAITKVINGGTNGLQDRRAAWERAKAAIT